jgi:ribosomal protein S18 acetylase RimI-like enzyme
MLLIRTEDPDVDQDEQVSELRLLVDDDTEAISTMLARAFHDDPVQAWLFPRATRRRQRLECFYRRDLQHRLLGRAVAWTTADRAGAAFWMPPDTWQIRWHQALRIAPAFRSLASPRGVRALRLLAAIEAGHPHEPHWYLAHLAVDPSAQRRGLGAALLRRGIERADHEGLPCYLESSSDRNTPYYRRFGFDVIQRVEVPGAPPVSLMWRPVTT